MIYEKTMIPNQSTVWENKYGCSKQHRCEFSVYITTVLETSKKLTADRAMGAPVHGRNLLDG